MYGNISDGRGSKDGRIDLRDAEPTSSATPKHSSVYFQHSTYELGTNGKMKHFYK